jgi:hypothetical protein
MANLRKKTERIKLVWKEKTPRLFKIGSFEILFLRSRGI